MSDRWLAPQLKRESILSSVSRLDPLPAQFTCILQALNLPDLAIGRLVELLSMDQDLAASILRAANSSRSECPAPFNKLGEVVDTLGLMQVHALVACAAAAEKLKSQLKGYRLGNGELWRHSLATAGFAHGLALSLSYQAPEAAYAAGLLHDLGKLLLDPFILAEYVRIVELMWKRKLYLWQIEQRLFGTDHAQVGEWMAWRWHFPPDLAHAIRWHHEPTAACPQLELAALVHVADAMAPPDSLGLSTLEGRMVLPQALQILDLTLPALERLRVTLQNTPKD